MFLAMVVKETISPVWPFVKMGNGSSTGIALQHFTFVF
jgi:hypothetical protein